MIIKGHILTHSGVLVNPLDPDPDTICIEDIVWSLAQQCRYNGHTSDFYSVAEHSVYVSRFVKPENALYGLLHDATEAYLCDVPRPIKPLLVGYYEIEDTLMKCIAAKFGLPATMPLDVKQVDGAMLLPERDRLMPSDIGDWTQLEGAPDLREKVTIACLQPEAARQLFWERLKELT